VTTILLVRHGETDWNLERRWQGHTDRPLNETGRAQARELADLLATDPPDAVYSSDLARARETAEIVAARLGLPVAVDARLREVDVGEWSGLTMAEIEERFPEALQRRLAGGTGWERGETYEQMGERVVAALGEIAERHDGGRVVVITHGGSVRAALHAAGVPDEERPHVRNCAVHPVHVEDGTIRRID
jgi:broad specificity phosphatase PhoE